MYNKRKSEGGPHFALKYWGVKGDGNGAVDQWQAGKRHPSTAPRVTWPPHAPELVLLHNYNHIIVNNFASTQHFDFIYGADLTRGRYLSAVIVSLSYTQPVLRDAVTKSGGTDIQTYRWNIFLGWFWFLQCMKPIDIRKSEFCGMYIPNFNVIYIADIPTQFTIHNMSYQSE